MKKINLFTLLLILLAANILVSCSSDDDEKKEDNNGNINYSEMIVGWWKMTYSSEGDLDEDDKTSIFKIEANKTYWNGNDNGNDYGTWSMEGNIFRFKSQKWGLSFETEITEITKDIFTSKTKLGSASTIASYERVK